MTTTALSATELSRLIHAGEVSCRQVMTDHLDRIEEFNPRINAIVSLRNRTDLLEEADKADRERAGGVSRGPLHGFPFAIKDLAEAKGLPCSFGSRIYADHVSDHDDIHVARIRAAGAILIGKTNTPEMGLGSQSYNDVFGTTRNPWDLSRCAGGSSGGAAAALAARLVPLADGSDMMGSLRNPASFNNVVGFRPSFGAVPSLSTELYLGTLSTDGPMARSVEDVAMLLGVMAEWDRRAPFSIDLPEEAQDPKRPLRVGWLGDYGGYLPIEPEVIAICRSALAAFEQLGANVEDADPRFDMNRLWQCWRTIRHFLVANSQGEDYADPVKRALMKPELIWEIENGRTLSAADVYQASLIRSDWYRAMLSLFDRFDALVLPSAQVLPFPAEMHWPQEIAGHRMDTYHRWMEVVIGPTLAGLPVAAMPAGFSASGLPVGIQIIGRPRGDHALLALARAYEGATGWLQRTPPLR